MRKAREYGVPGLGARDSAAVQRKLEGIRRRCESTRAVARTLFAQPWRSRQAQECGGATDSADDRAEHQARLRAPIGLRRAVPRAARRSEELGRGETRRKVPHTPAATFEASYSEP